ncbi:MAG: hypothetical protein IJG63_05780 [Oscillospiraceae bacterium]|nr:hypothetical protein [Oscillospiraceae bacterium]
MTDKEIRRMSRRELAIALCQLQQKEEQLRQDNEQLREKLGNVQIKIDEAGSIAEAAAGINDIFGVAQKTADQYLAEIRAANSRSEQYIDRLTSEAQSRADELRTATESECAELRERTQRECAELREKTEQECWTMREEAERDVKEQWEKLSQKANELLAAHAEMRSLLEEL